AIISAENEYISTRLRLKAYRDTLVKHNLAVREDYITHAARDYSFKSGKWRAKELLGVDPRPTAIFCISDTLALGAITAARELGLRVPEDVTVVGFDDVEHTTMLHPYITTVAQPCYELGKQSAHLLHARMTRGAEIPRQTILEHRLIVRESSSPPASLD
ncbi:MAG: LacI family transcriptional regulator, partial [Rhodocyclaceae bacterium]|nr:LacI family transcriptional regulator [Rhodocyclaceae bacterium]